MQGGVVVGVVGGGDRLAYPPPLFRCGHKEGTPGPPAGRKVGQVGGVSLQVNAEMRAPAGLAPLYVGAKTAPESVGALPELAERPLWQEGPV